MGRGCDCSKILHDVPYIVGTVVLYFMMDVQAFNTSRWARGSVLQLPCFEVQGS